MVYHNNTSSFPFFVVILFIISIFLSSSDCKKCDLANIFIEEGKLWSKKEEIENTRYYSVSDFYDLTDFVWTMNGVEVSSDSFNDEKKVAYIRTKLYIVRDYKPNSAASIGSNVGSVAYVETWHFNDGKEPKTLQSHEHTLFTINDDCLITKVDQIVDMAEQNAMFTRLGEILQTYKEEL